MIRLISFATILLAATTVAADTALPKGFWDGHAERDGTTLQFQIRLRTDGNGALEGAIDIPEFYLLGVPLLASIRRGARVTLDFGQDAPEYRLEGRVKGARFVGTWSWLSDGFTCPHELARIDDPRPYTIEEVRYRAGDVTLAASLYVPKTPASHPAIAFAHGSGNNIRWRREFRADFFARQGIETLLTDKRGDGASEGDWRTVGFETLADDAIAGIHYLQSRADVDPSRVGLWGISQAGWIMPLAASRSRDVAFIVSTSGPAVPVEEQLKFEYLVRLRDAGFSREDMIDAERILDLDFHVSMTGEGYNDLVALTKGAREKPWYAAMKFTIIPPRMRDFFKLIGGFDPRPVLEQVDIPMLWMYGSEDKSVDPVTSIAILNDIIAQKSRPWTIVTFAEADHGIRLPRDPSAPFPHDPFPLGHWESMSDWLSENVLTPH